MYHPHLHICITQCHKFVHEFSHSHGMQNRSANLEGEKEPTGGNLFQGVVIYKSESYKERWRQEYPQGGFKGLQFSLGFILPPCLKSHR